MQNNFYQHYAKRILDIIFALLCLPLFMILVLPLAILIYFDDRGFVFYNSYRLGKNAIPFTMFKFRTMIMNAPDIRLPDGSTYNSDNDPRLTKVGKFLRKTSLDEIPQLLNVLKGDMSFIGPRPTIRAQVDKYTERQKKRLKFKPGITGLAQVSGRNKLSWPERIEKDIEYIEQYSLLLDINIFFKTFFVVLFPQDIYGNDGNKGL